MKQINWVSQKDLADALGITVNHLKHYIKIGKVRSVKMYGRLLVDPDTTDIEPKKQLNPKRGKPEKDFI